MIDVALAGQLLNFGARIGDGPRADEQLRGAVAIHNILEKHRVAYLADEVGMGKTFVALGALALFRHFQPDFRVAIIAPKENIQDKWMKEFGNFVAHNVRFPDLRVAAIDRQPARPFVRCGSFIEFVREAVIDPRRDFFLRLTSFSLALGDDAERRGWRRLRDDLRKEVPWLPEATLDLRSNKEAFKDNFARAACCALPEFDLLIVDEGHNLKHGFRAGVAARNRVLALAFGHPAERLARKDFPGYGPRAKRVLFLSATPLEETYQHIWNQLDVFGLSGPFAGLRDDRLSDEEKKRLAAEFLVRRVTTMRMGGEDLTKNQYRREWRRGGVHAHDDPIQVVDDRQRLVVALVQKKVAELLGSEKFNMSFQVGMLASFESFLETTRLKRSDEGSEGNFDDTDQTAQISDDSLKAASREGIDVRDVNRMTRDYRNTFGKEMPHPKMDALVESLQTAWTTGKKSLVFVRRVKSVDELKRKLDEKYDEWLLRELRERLPQAVLPRFNGVVENYLQERRLTEEARRAQTASQAARSSATDQEMDDRGGTDTFFAWFFRGEGPPGVVSGANIQKRFIKGGSAYSTFFEDNHVMALLGARPGGVAAALGGALGLDPPALSQALAECAAKYLGRARKLTRADRVEAAQAAALELLMERADDLGERARGIWHERFETSVRKAPASVPRDVTDALEQATFFTELRQPGREALREALWPEPRSGTEREKFREQELRGQLLAAAARLGHSLIDLYILTIGRIGSLAQRTLEVEGEGGENLDVQRIDEYLDLLDHQRRTSLGERGWATFDELSQIAANFHLILDVNDPEAHTRALVETPRQFGTILGQQQPVGGMSGQVNKTVVKQFRMPGYPFVLVTTDLLQEGEDLHTFCSAVHHYGIAWTPSSMEQRIGRIDRVRSQSERRLAGLEMIPDGADFLQVYYPHLEDTVEVFQVQRVFARMNTFLRLMHEGLAIPKGEQGSIDVNREMVAGPRFVEAIRERLQSAFPIPIWSLEGKRKALVTTVDMVESILRRFDGLAQAAYPDLPITWERPSRKGVLLGTARLGTGRVQPFALLLKSDGERLVVRCVSPVGRVGPEDALQAIEESVRSQPVRLGVIRGSDDAQYDLTVEDDVLLGAASLDVARVGLLLRRVLHQSDLLEQIHLPARDEPLAAFETDLKREGDAYRG